MSPETKIKATIILQAREIWGESFIGEPHSMSEDEIIDLYDDSESALDIVYDFREGEVETDIPCECSRNYELKSVAAKMFDGSWVGWTYWYGGGKHGNPEEIPWMEYAYDLDCIEEEKLVTVRTFSKKN